MSILQKLRLQYFRRLFYLTELKRHQWHKKEVIIRLQEKRLRALIDHAYHKVEFYQNLFDSVGIKPQDIKTVHDLQKIPTITKETVRKNYPDNIVAKGVDITKCHTRSTTGSTGIPLKIHQNAKELDYFVSANVFVWLSQGLRLRDKFVGIRHEGFHVTNTLLKKIRIFNFENISIFNPLEDIIEALKDSNPDIITSYPSMLLLLSEEIESRNITGISPRIIRSVGETLNEYTRKKIGGTFNSQILAQYGSEEFGALAFECIEHSGYHVVSDAVIIEIVKDHKHVAHDEEGEIVVTGLYNYTMPLIRYKIGDIGRFTEAKCACGRGFPLIKNIEGRTDDFLILPSGKKVSPRVINVIEEIPGVSSYKTIQETKNKIVVYLVEGKGFSSKTVDEIKSHIKDGCFGEDVDVIVRLVEELPRNSRGKLRAVISNVND